MEGVSRRAGIYVRISSDPEGLRLGVQRQLEDCEALCHRRGWAVVDVFEDNDRSAYRGKPRPEYQRMLENVEAGRVDAIVVWSQDRLTRHPREMEEFLDVIDGVGGVELATVSGDRDLATSDGRAMARVVGAFAAKESADKAARHRRKARQLAEQGKVGGGGTRPFGFETDRRTIIESEAVLIRDAAKRLLAGESQSSVLRDWEARGVTTPMGGPWRLSTFRRMMRSARIAGIREHRGEEVGPAEWDGIIDEATHQRLLGRLQGTGAHKVYRERRYMLTGGLAVCGLCGKPLTSTRRNQKRTMICPSGPGRGGCGRISVMAEPVEEFVGRVVIEALDGPLLQQAIAADRQEGSRDAGIAAQIAAKQETLDQVAVDFYTKSEITRSQFTAATRALEAEIEALRAKLTRNGRTRILTSLPGTRDALQAAWDQADIGWRRALVTAVIDKITVNPTGARRNRFDPTRLDITWHA